MIWLLFATFLASQLFVIFQLIEGAKVKILPVLVLNYFVACTIGTIVTTADNSWPAWRPDLFLAVLVGGMFIGMFFLMARSTVLYGMGVTTIAAKLSVVLPFFLGVILFNEVMNWVNLLGIALALFSIWAATRNHMSYAAAKLPLLIGIGLFFGNGLIDISLKLMEAFVLAPGEIPSFTVLLFGSAGIIGLLIVLGRKEVSNFKSKSTWKWGLTLGIVNYFSIYLFMIALSSGIPTNIAFPTYSIGLVVLATIWGVVFFKERKSLINWVGLGTAIMAIFLLTRA